MKPSTFMKPTIIAVIFIFFNFDTSAQPHLNEVKQTIIGNFKSAFNPQDIYSNILGINFFNSYGGLIKINPTQISNYIYKFLTDPRIVFPSSFSPNWPSGPKY